MKKPAPFGKYYLLERINVGGMAEVFRAKAYGVEGFERLVAVKRILPNIAEDKEFIRMFIDEAKIAVQLNHANIAQIFDLGVVDGSYYIALEHIHGRDLRNIFDRCRGGGEPMPIAQACFVSMKICEGLDYAHNKRDQAGRELHLVHRDVSPQNMLVSFEGEVKLIDFGIAKAAGKGSKTQAGILKGKFGYMSPEQVRGLPIDRRSDIFSCGIVLYELLTGERLFVGESDFSTLEKVRNVEILPPSTYNRKIPDELERIVLKALAKDSDDRYQNAIDLHDELQAFVYTAGEFYSRKDLAAWMKKTFSKEIEEETAKLEQYRQLKPPAEVVGAPRAGTKPPPPTPTTPPPVRRTTAMPAVPPPAPANPSGAHAVVSPPAPPPPAGTKPPPLGSPRTTLPMQAVAPPPPSPASTLQGMPAMQSAPPTAHPPIKVTGNDQLSWDDDELETQIYDNPEEEAAAKARAAGFATPGAPGPGAAGAPGGDDGPDLSSLVSTAKGWDSPGGAPQPPKAGPNAPTLLSAGTGPMPPPGQLAAGSAKSTNPFPPSNGAGAYASPFGAEIASSLPPRRESSAIERLVSAGPAPSDFEMSAFGSNMVGRQQKSNVAIYAAVGGAVALLGGGFLVYKLATGGSGSSSAPASAGSGGKGGSGEVAKGSDTGKGPASGGSAAASGSSVASGSAAASGSSVASGSASGDVGSGAASGTGTSAGSAVATGPALTAEQLHATGFDLYVTPNNVSAWRIDSQVNTSRLPAQIRAVQPGHHMIQIDAPPGFMSTEQAVEVEAGKAPRVEITLTPIDIVGVFTTTPAGARVYLVVNGQRVAIGQTPIKYKLDPRMTYQVIIEKDGFVSVSRPLAISGNPEEDVTVVLEKAQVAIHDGGGRVPHGGGNITPPGGGHDGGNVTPPGGGHDGGNVTPPGSGHDGGNVTPPGGGHDGGTPPNGGHEGSDGGSPAEGGEGILSLGAKPPCDIYIDGRQTGLKTPQREIKLSAGHHKVTLMNNEFSIKESFGVDIKAGAPTKVVKDFSDRIPQ